ncbi:MBL fold metallo-hydrolase [Candidatus Falkowbacteria bacterium]|jgi:L-ascorbate metabolism protein UlaG (beta-lactamase superfamily)|nr:MBL fold metallo-hydrolase [Candidatus Falkowbacteria bacterium]MBT4432746.1 MBL fold metallo-hydrolase [Candidatus Falkowbacteria bacterium]
MQIIWHGQSCFTVKSKPRESTEEITVVINPFDPKKTGLKLSKLKADIFLLGCDDLDNNITKNTAAFTVNSPGEFEIKNNFIAGINSAENTEKKQGKNIIFSLEIEGVHLIHLGELTSLPEGDILSKIQNVDVLMVPVGGNKVINAKQAIEIINQIEPRIIIPMYYKIPGSKEKLDGVNGFIKELGHNGEETFDKFKINKKNLPNEENKVIILNKK